MKATKAVFVTGASTGIGRRITERLAAQGCYVYAGARKDADLRALGAIENVNPCRLDVTRSRDVSAVVDLIVRDGFGLYGLVNNAGVATLGPLVDGDEGEFELVMAVNILGPYRVTRALAPMILAAKGRIVTIGSISGVLADANAGVYSMSKHAIEAFTDSLALEMEHSNVHVSVIEPGTFSTDLVKNAIARLGPNPLFPDLTYLPQPDEVCVAVEHALFAPRPKRRYLVVTSETEARKTICKQLEQLVQLNEGHVHTYDRRTLIQLLDEALEQSCSRTHSSYSRGS